MQEVKIIGKLAAKGVRVPKLVSINEEKYYIEMEYIEGLKLKDYINDPAITPAQIK
jgi:tRNA A-37 threonylcarbamoyl transferase component Bud32